jgi:hypothetical protein
LVPFGIAVFMNGFPKHESTVELGRKVVVKRRACQWDAPSKEASTSKGRWFELRQEKSR